MGRVGGRGGEHGEVWGLSGLFVARERAAPHSFGQRGVGRGEEGAPHTWHHTRNGDTHNTNTAAGNTRLPQKQSLATSASY